MGKKAKPEIPVSLLQNKNECETRDTHISLAKQKRTPSQRYPYLSCKIKTNAKPEIPISLLQNKNERKARDTHISLAKQKQTPSQRYPYLLQNKNEFPNKSNDIINY